MEAIKDYKRKWDKLWLFFSMLPKTEIGIKDKGEHKGERYDNKSYKFTDQYRKEFNSVLNQAENLFISCGVDIIELESEIAHNATEIGLIRKSLSDYMKWPQYDPKQSAWLNSLLEAGVIDKVEFACVCSHIRACAETMRDNVQIMKQLLDKYDMPQPPKVKQNKAKGGNRTDYFIDVFLDTDCFDTVVNTVKEKTSVSEIVEYFEELKRKGVISDFPSAGALERQGIELSKDEVKSYTNATYYRRNK